LLISQKFFASYAKLDPLFARKALVGVGGGAGKNFWDSLPEQTSGKKCGGS